MDEDHVKREARVAMKTQSANDFAKTIQPQNDTRANTTSSLMALEEAPPTPSFLLSHLPFLQHERDALNFHRPLDRESSPHFPNQLPPRPQQLRLPALLVPHLGHAEAEGVAGGVGAVSAVHQGQEGCSHEKNGKTNVTEFTDCVIYA